MASVQLVYRNKEYGTTLRITGTSAWQASGGWRLYVRGKNLLTDGTWSRGLSYLPADLLAPGGPWEFVGIVRNGKTVEEV